MKYSEKYSGKKYIKYAKIKSVLSDFVDLKKSKLLDIGCGNGVITEQLSNSFKESYGVDVYDRRLASKGYNFFLVNNESLPFKDKYFDVVISNQVIEHVNNQDEHVKEIFRVLNDKGVCYIATPNKYWPIEPHYYLPFLGILPKGIANFYLTFFIGEKYDVNLLSYNGLKNKLSYYFEIIDFTFVILKYPHKYNLEKRLRIIPSFLVNKFTWGVIKYVVPSFVFVLKKK